MYILNIKKLKETLSTTGLTQKACFYYVLISGILISAGMELIAYSPRGVTNIWDNINSLGSLIILMMGIYLSYKANGGDKGGNFLERNISIGFVVTLRYIPLLFVLIICFFIYISLIDYSSEETHPMGAILLLLWNCFIWNDTVRHIRDVANASHTKHPTIDA